MPLISHLSCSKKQINEKYDKFCLPLVIRLLFTQMNSSIDCFSKIPSGKKAASLSATFAENWMFSLL